MRLLLIIGAFDGRHRNILEQNIKKFQQYNKYETEIVIMSGEQLYIETHGVQWKFFDKSYGEKFLWNHLKVLKEKENNGWDLFAFLEDDVYLSEDNLDYYVEHSDRLKGTEYSPGLIRYEQWEDKKYLVGMTYSEWEWGHAIDKVDFKYWTVHRKYRLRPVTHQCGYIVDKDRFKDMIRSGFMYPEPHVVRYGRGRRLLGDLESASNWLWAYKYRKVWPVDDLERSLLFHCDHYTRHPIGPEKDEFIRKAKIYENVDSNIGIQ